MLAPRSKRSTLQRLLACGLVTTAIGVFTPAPANAHFILQTPASWNSQDALGSPQKLGPCGSEEGGTPTGTVTAFQAGQTITVTINETIFHPGHYRISLGVNGPDDLPEVPVVTPGTNTPCGTAPIEANPTFPVLADGVFEHQAPFDGPQTVTITLPADVTCEHCSLQVLEFMSNHALNDPGGCYYHHCANISIQSDITPDGASSTTTGTGSTADTGASVGSGAGGTGAGGANPSGGSTDTSSGCRFTGVPGADPTLTGLAGLVAIAALIRRRLRR